MARFLFASIPIPAHTSNPLPFAARLVERGHSVHWYAGAVYHDRIRSIGAVPVPYRAATDFGGQEVLDAFPQLAGSGPRVIGRAFADVFVGEAPGRVADLRPVVEELGIDAMLSDGLMFGVGMLGELTGIPYATFGDGPLPYEEPDTPPFGPGLLPMRGPVGRLRNRVVSAAGRALLFRTAARRYAAIRSDLGLPPDPAYFLYRVASPMLHLQGCTPAFDYPRAHVPPSVHWVGALRPDPVPGWSPPSWWPLVTSGSRPVVHVSQGTIRPDTTELIVPALRALAAADVLVVVTTGGPSADDVAAAYGGPLPANAVVTPFVPYGELLPHASVFVTNGGYTGVTLALDSGVPIVQAGTTEEKSEIGARIQWSGVGLRLGTTRPSPSLLADSVARVLGEPSFRAAAGRVRAEMEVHDAGLEGAVLLERLAATRAPVTEPVAALRSSA